MAIRHLIAGLGVAVATLLLGAQSASACDCHDGGPVCEAFWKTPVIFAGRVEAITPMKLSRDSEPDQRVRFRVIEALRGTSADVIDIFNYGSSCSFTFEIGEEWIIYAFPLHSGSGLTTSTCSRTRILRAAGEDLAYGRSAYKASSDNGRIFGRLIYRGADSLMPVSGIRVTLSGLWVDKPSVLTDQDGRYEFSAPSGAYRLTPSELTPGMSFAHAERLIELRDERGCVLTAVAG